MTSSCDQPEALKLTAWEGSGQQWMAAPAWMADRDSVAKGKRPTSALRSMNFLRMMSPE